MCMYTYVYVQRVHVSILGNPRVSGTLRDRGSTFVWIQAYLSSCRLNGCGGAKRGFFVSRPYNEDIMRVTSFRRGEPLAFLL